MAQTQTIPDQTTVVVADGEGARFFNVNRQGAGLTLHQTGTMEPEELADSGPAGHRPPEQTEAQTNEATFAKQLAHRLYELTHSGEIKSLVLFADPQTLGQVRGLLHKEVTDRLIADVDKTLTNSSIDDIQAQLNAL